MLERLFISVLNMSLTGGYVILFVLIVRLLLKKAPKIFSYALWGIVLFRLLCPVSFESVFSLMPTGNAPISQDIIYSAAPQISTGVGIIDHSINSLLPAPNIGDSVNPIQIWIFIGTVIWALGMLAMLIYSIAALIKLKRSLIGAAPLKENIFLADHISSPFVMGLFKPKIYLSSSLSDTEKDFIIAHEMCHIKRLDHFTRILGFVALAVHWFNPLVWVAFIGSGKDMELSCDEAVMKKMNTDIRAEYSQSLLRFGTTNRMIHATPLAFGEGDTKSRVKNVLHYKRPAFWVVVISVIAVLAIVIGLAVNPKSERASMQWAKNLQVEDIVSAELVTTYGDESNRYQRYESEQLTDIVKLVNGSSGKYLPQPEPIAGGGMTLYITTLDGTRHSVGNNANVYLEIDGDSFEMSRFAVDGWGWYHDGHAPVPEEFFKDDSPASESLSDDYNGLSQEEYEGLEAERARFEAMSTEDQYLLLESGGVGCSRFEHLWWEDSIDSNFIRLVGIDAFDDWVTAQREQEQCSDIYSFAKRFGLDYPTLERVIIENDLTEIYPLERLKARAAVFGVLSEGYAEYIAKVTSNGITEEEARSLENGGIPREKIVTMTREEATKWLDEAMRIHQENYDQSMFERLGGDFLELARSGEGAYYDRQNDRLVGRGQVESFIRAVESKDTGGFVYFSDRTGEQIIYNFSVDAGSDFYAIDRYHLDGTKESFVSKSADKRENDYRLGDDLVGDGFPIYLPFSSGNSENPVKLVEFGLTDVNADPQKIGEAAFHSWLDTFTQEETPAEQRLTAYTIDKITVISGTPKAGQAWEDMNYHYVVRADYSITTASEKYRAAGDGVSGKGTFGGLFRELCVRALGDGRFEIFSVGTGGGEQEFLQ